MKHLDPSRDGTVEDSVLFVSINFTPTVEPVSICATLMELSCPRKCRIACLVAPGLFPFWSCKTRDHSLTAAVGRSKSRANVLRCASLKSQVSEARLGGDAPGSELLPVWFNTPVDGASMGPKQVSAIETQAEVCRTSARKGSWLTSGGREDVEKTGARKFRTAAGRDELFPAR
jgi:hypothetical protein